MAAMFVNGSGQNEQSLERTFHRCFLLSFTSFGWGVSEEKIKMWKVNTTYAKWWQKLTLPLVRSAKNQMWDVWRDNNAPNPTPIDMGIKIAVKYYHVYIWSSLLGVCPLWNSFNGWCRPWLQNTLNNKGHVWNIYINIDYISPHFII